MSTILDYFNTPHFTARALTDAVNIIPNTYGRLGQLNLFPVKPLATTYVEIEYKDGVLSLLPVKSRGASGTQNRRGKRAKRLFDIPYIPHDDTLLASDLQNYVKFGTVNVVETLMDATNDKLEGMRGNHDITLEFLRMGALKGQIVDCDGNLIYDLFDEFNITQFVLNFELNKPTTKVDQKCRQLKRYVERNLRGEVSNGKVRVIVSSEFFDMLIAHPSVEKAYMYYAAAQNPLREDTRAGFEFHGVIFEEYNATASAERPDGSSVEYRFIAEGDGHAYPVGTRQTFQTYAAPANTISEVNQAPKASDLIYVKQERMKFDQGIEFHTEMSPLPFAKRPALLVDVKAE